MAEGNDGSPAMTLPHTGNWEGGAYSSWSLQGDCDYKFSQYLPINWDDSAGHSQQGPIAQFSCAFLPLQVIFVSHVVNAGTKYELYLSPTSSIHAYIVGVLEMRSAYSG